MFEHNHQWNVQVNQVDYNSYVCLLIFLSSLFYKCIYLSIYRTLLINKNWIGLILAVNFNNQYENLYIIQIYIYHYWMHIYIYMFSCKKVCFYNLEFANSIHQIAWSNKLSPSFHSYHSRLVALLTSLIIFWVCLFIVYIV